MALDRIATYLAEDEVSDQVSSLSNGHSEPDLPVAEEEGFGLETASFKWNEVEPVDEDKKDKKTASSTAESGLQTEPAIPTEDLTDHHFELKDITVRFPEGQLSVITGPTASGKTALLVSDKRHSSFQTSPNVII